MIRTRETGWARIVFAGGHTSDVALDELESLRSAWKRGEAFWTGLDAYGDSVTIKLGAVVQVAAATPEGIVLAREDRLADAQDDAIRGVE